MTETKLVWSKYQLAIFDAVRNSNKNIVIQASAGSAKTSSIVEASKLIPKNQQVAFFAFNKSIAETLQTKVSVNTTASTLHSYGYGLLLKKFEGKIDMNNYKTTLFAKKHLKEWDIKDNIKDLYLYNLSKCIELMRLTQTFEQRDVEQLVDWFDIYDENNLVINALQVYEELMVYNHQDLLSPKEKKMIDFTDMIHLPIHLKNIFFKTYDVVFIDETQDLNTIQMLLVEKTIKRGGRFICVGDVRQSIYQWSGSNGQSFEYFESKPNTIKLPLSISYRCPKSVVLEAQKIYSEIEVWNKAEEGVVREAESIDEIQEGDFVLCRINKPLVRMYYDMLKLGKKSYIKGKDFGVSLQLMVKKAIDKTSHEAVLFYTEELFKIKEKLKDKNYENIESHSRVTTYKEKVDIIKILLAHHFTMKAVYTHLEKMFSDEDQKGVMLSSVHKIKGGECDNVFIIRPDLLEDKWRYQKDTDIIAQKNLRFVAYTRAKKELITIPLSVFDDRRMKK